MTVVIDVTTGSTKTASGANSDARIILDFFIISFQKNIERHGRRKNPDIKVGNHNRKSQINQYWNYLKIQSIPTPWMHKRI